MVSYLSDGLTMMDNQSGKAQRILSWSQQYIMPEFILQYNSIDACGRDPKHPKRTAKII